MEDDDRSTWPPRPPGRRITVLELMGLVAAVALGLWLVLPEARQMPQPKVLGSFEPMVLVVVAVLGGLSLVGPVLLVRERLRGRRRPFRGGEVLWFCQGMAGWLLWPPVVYARLEGRKFGETISGPCYYYGTPLMAVYVTSALLAGRWIGPRRRKRARSWREQFGLILGLLWACTGAYFLYVFCRNDFKI
jgi:hypothetical protein